jgi:NADH:ubiquinone oxidoreductase subunit 6 (subunit J)
MGDAMLMVVVMAGGCLLLPVVLVMITESDKAKRKEKLKELKQEEKAMGGQLLSGLCKLWKVVVKKG